MKFRYPRNPSTQRAWLTRKALEIKPLLPASNLELQRKLGLSKNTIGAVIATLRKTETVYTVQAGKKISYEIKEKE